MTENSHDQHGSEIPVLFNIDDLNTGALEAMSMLSEDDQLRIKARYGSDAEFNFAGKALIADLATRVSAADTLEEPEWTKFYEAIQNLESPPSFYLDDDILTLSKAILRYEAIAADGENDQRTLSRMVLLSRLINIESLI